MASNNYFKVNINSTFRLPDLYHFSFVVNPVCSILCFSFTFSYATWMEFESFLSWNLFLFSRFGNFRVFDDVTDEQCHKTPIRFLWMVYIRMAISRRVPIFNKQFPFILTRGILWVFWVPLDTMTSPCARVCVRVCGGGGGGWWG